MQRLALKDGTGLQGGCGLVAMPVPGTELDAGYRIETNFDRNFNVDRPLIATIYNRSTIARHISIVS